MRKLILTLVLILAATTLGNAQTALGAIVYDGNYNLNGCDLSNLSQGVYFCKVKIGMNTYFSKFIN